MEPIQRVIEILAADIYQKPAIWCFRHLVFVLANFCSLVFINALDFARGDLTRDSCRTFLPMPALTLEAIHTSDDWFCFNCKRVDVLFSVNKLTTDLLDVVAVLDLGEIARCARRACEPSLRQARERGVPAQLAIIHCHPFLMKISRINQKVALNLKSYVRKNSMEEKEFWGYLAGAALPEVFWELESVFLCRGAELRKILTSGKIAFFQLNRSHVI